MRLSTVWQCNGSEIDPLILELKSFYDKRHLLLFSLFTMSDSVIIWHLSYHSGHLLLQVKAFPICMYLFFFNKSAMCQRWHDDVNSIIEKFTIQVTVCLHFVTWSPLVHNHNCQKATILCQMVCLLQLLLIQCRETGGVVACSCSQRPPLIGWAVVTWSVGASFSCTSMAFP